MVCGTDAAKAQTPPPVPIEQPSPAEAASALVRDGYRLHAELDAVGALERFRSAVGIAPLHYEALWLAAAESVAVGILSDSEEASTRLFAEAVDFARRAVAVRPNGVEAHEWLAVALGRHALSVGIRQRVRFAEEILATASRAVALDSTSAVGHHVIGQWHAEVRRVSGLERFIARRFLGGVTFGSASHALAVHHLERAVALNPVELVHRFELGRVYLDVDRPSDAQEQFQAIIDQAVVAPTDTVYKARARRCLSEECDR